MSYRLPIRRSKQPTAEVLQPYLSRIDAARMYSNSGPLVQEFESRLAVHFEAPEDHIITTPSCTAALTLSLLVLQRARGMACVLPSFTFIACPMAVLSAGMQPVFADVDPKSLMLTPDSIEPAIAAAGGIERVGAIMVVSAYGATPDIDAWSNFQSRTGIPCILDSAWCFGTAKLAPVVQCISMHATKSFGIGEGGCIISNSSAHAKQLRQAANFGLDATRSAQRVGTNAKLSEYGAAVGLAGLDELPQRKANAKRIGAAYEAGFSGCNQVSVLNLSDDSEAPGTVFAALEGCSALQVQEDLRSAGIEARHWWGMPCTQHSVFKDYPQAALPVSSSLETKIINFPYAEDMTNEDIAQVITTALTSIAS